MTKEIKNGQLKVWWIPQVPMQSFDVLIDNLQEAKLLLTVLADYDKFQFDNNIKPDYGNAGGVCVWDDRLEPDGYGDCWTDWHDPETDMDFDEAYLRG